MLAVRSDSGAARRDARAAPLIPQPARGTRRPDSSRSCGRRLEAREALSILASLPERQRADLSLLVAVFSYREIAQMTGGRTHTNVNKHIAKARARVRPGDWRGADEGAKNRRRDSL